MRMHRRTVGIFSAMVLAMTLLLFRLGAIIQGDGLSQAAPVSYTHLDVYKRQSEGSFQGVLL